MIQAHSAFAEDAVVQVEKREAVQTLHAELEQSPATSSPPLIAAAQTQKPPALQYADEIQVWSRHFAVYEKTKSGDLVPITPKHRFVDSASDVIVQRISGEPQEIRTHRFEQDASKICARPTPDAELSGVAVEAWIVRRSGSHWCRYLETIDGVTESSRLTADEQRLLPSDCSPKKTVVTSGVSIRKGDSFTLHADKLNHNDDVEIQFYGCGYVLEDKSRCSANTCALNHSFVRTTAYTVSFRVVDMHSIVAHEDPGDRPPAPISGATHRFDLSRQLTFDFSDHMTPRSLRTDAALRDVLDFEVQAISASGEQRSLKVTQNNGLPAVEMHSMHDNETVTTVVKRRVTLTDGSTKAIETNIATFESAGVGLHYAPAGDYRAHYATASTVAVVLDKSKSRPAFAQTFAYSLYYKGREPSVLDHVAAGFHIAIIASQEQKNSDSGGAAPVSLGVGGQLTFGGDALHLGGGYDLIARNAYLMIGLSVADFIKILGLK